ncbi:MAG: hypothetical protein ACPHVZ_05745, partial [Psychrobacter sp.]
YDLNAAGYQGVRHTGRQWLTPDIHALEGCGFTALDDKLHLIHYRKEAYHSSLFFIPIDRRAI